MSTIECIRSPPLRLGSAQLVVDLRGRVLRGQLRPINTIVSAHKSRTRRILHLRMRGRNDACMDAPGWMAATNGQPTPPTWAEKEQRKALWMKAVSRSHAGCSEAVRCERLRPHRSGDTSTRNKSPGGRARIGRWGRAILLVRQSWVVVRAQRPQRSDSRKRQLRRHLKHSSDVISFTSVTGSIRVLLITRRSSRLAVR